MSHLFQPILGPVSRWAEQSQQRACRNAMVASTSISAVRRERDEVQDYVAVTLARRRAAADGSEAAPVAAPG